MGFQLGDIGSANTCAQSAIAAIFLGIYTVSDGGIGTMRFDVVNVNDEVLPRH